MTETDECVAEFAIPKSKHSLIVGKSGVTIRRISADNNVRINVPDKQTEPNNAMVQVRVAIADLQEYVSSSYHLLVHHFPFVCAAGRRGGQRREGIQRYR